MRMLKEISEDLNSIKKIQSDTKDTPIEVKNNLQGNNSRVNEAKNQSNGLEHKEEKNNQSEQEEEKRMQKMRIVSVASGKTSSVPTFAHRGTRRRREKTRNWKSI